MILVVRPTRSLRGTLTVPGDKSISHRAFLFASLARGITRIFSALNSDDVSRSRRAIESLGVAVREEDGAVQVEGRGAEALRPPSVELDMGNSGTTARLLLGILAGRPFSSTLIGDASLSRRPMRRVTEPLSQMGAKFEIASPRQGGTRNDVYLPLIVRGGSLRGIRYEMPVPSAQVKSALLLAGLQAEGRTTVVESVPTRDHTERMLRYMGAQIEIASPAKELWRARNDVIATARRSRSGKQSRITIEPSSLTAREIRVPGDFSSAAFFLAAAAMVPGSAVTVRGVGLNPTRTALLDLLRRMGAKVIVIPAKAGIKVETDLRIRGDDGEWEPLGDVTVSYASLKGITVEPELVPNVIDELPVLMAAATQAEGVTRLDGVGELRVKETNRIRSMVMNLSALGARIREEQESVIIEGPTPLRGAEVDAYGDHRTAMAMAVAGLVSSGSTTIRGSEWVRISFPEFAPTLDSLRRD